MLAALHHFIVEVLLFLFVNRRRLVRLPHGLAQDGLVAGQQLVEGWVELQLGTIIRRRGKIFAGRLLDLVELLVENLTWPLTLDS